MVSLDHIVDDGLDRNRFSYSFPTSRSNDFTCAIDMNEMATSLWQIATVAVNKLGILFWYYEMLNISFFARCLKYDSMKRKFGLKPSLQCEILTLTWIRWNFFKCLDTYRCMFAVTPPKVPCIHLRRGPLENRLKPPRYSYSFRRNGAVPTCPLQKQICVQFNDRLPLELEVLLQTKLKGM